MKPIHQFVVKAALPEKIEKLKEISMNYWWSWNREAKGLFHYIDRDLFIECNHNPILFFNKVDQNRLNQLMSDKVFIQKYETVIQEFNDYMIGGKWMPSSEEQGVIAYFSPEYGINESFPNYSGGLGVLSGDHMKSASDLGLPLVGIGLLYQEGYFRQHLTQNGWQNEHYSYNNFFTMPLNIVKNDNDEELIISIDFPDREVHARVWKLNVGIIQMFMLDTNIDSNSHDDRLITNRLYGGDRDTRIQQEMVLGIGGMKALKAMNIIPSVVHINEGHAAFALLERTYQFMQKYNMSFWEAKQITQASSVFTTHTPVPAGNETFVIPRIEHYLRKYIEKLEISLNDLFSLGRMDPGSNEENFSMTVLGLKLTAYHNGVSKLHGKISRRMWAKIWSNYDEAESPIGHITNGIHTKTWLAGSLEELFDKYIGKDWRVDTDSNDVWMKAEKIPDKELWEAKKTRRTSLIEFARKRLANSKNSYLSQEQIRKIDKFLDPDTLTIGFARRFATYKRADLLFSDMERLKKIFNNEERPVQMVLAGKAHPHDTAGKETIQSIVNKIKEHGLEKKIIFIEDYDMVVGRILVKGCDIWLNNPIRPLEASGTSGMKAALNGGLNLSILDGWWDESFDNKNGFSIGAGEEYPDKDEQRYVEAGELYDVLENEVVKTFYKVNKAGLPKEWIAKMKHAISSIAGNFSTHRMVKDYTEKYYIPANSRYFNMISNNGQAARDLRNWKVWMIQNWDNITFSENNVEIGNDIFIGDNLKVSTKLFLGDLNPADVRVQVYYGDVAPHDHIENIHTQDLELEFFENGFAKFRGTFSIESPGKKGITFRVVPSNKLMASSREMYLCKWA